MRRKLVWAVLGLSVFVLTSGPALAKFCPPARGYTVYGKASFSTFRQERSIEADGMRLVAAPNTTNYWLAKEKLSNAWICGNVHLPNERTNKVESGLVFWHVDSLNFHAATATPDGGILVSRWVSGKWSEVKRIWVSDMVATADDWGSKDTSTYLEVIVTGNRVQIFRNDTRIATIEETAPSTPWSAGLHAQSRSNESYKARFTGVEIIELK